MNPQEIIDEFFIQDGATQSNGKYKRSFLLAVVDDLQFCVLLYKRWKNVKLTDDQKNEQRKIMPTFAIVSLFCSAVDLLSRVTNKNLPQPRQNGTYFKDCAMLWLGLSQDEAEQLWLLRNSISHNYSLNNGQIVIQFGHNRLIRQNNHGYWEFYLHAMYTALSNAKQNIYEHLTNEPQSDKQATMNFLNTHGFFYTR